MKELTNKALSLKEALCLGCFTEIGKVAQCPSCGFLQNQPEVPNRLPLRQVLQNQYVVGKILGKPGGFGVTYLAFDVNLSIKVAIKEFFPSNLVLRDTDRLQVIPDSSANAEVFKEGLKGFLKEARLLARMDHANVVRVKNFFEANGTGYLVMDFYEGQNLNEVLLQKGLFSEAEAMQIMLPVLDGLRLVHELGILHRDIKPENIYLAQSTTGLRPLLLDFGAARAAMGSKSQNMTLMLTPGFAPLEQYASTSKQTPATDVYACGATLYYLTTGRIPVEATERIQADDLIPPQAHRALLSDAFNHLVLKALALRQEDRFASIHALQDAILDLLTSSRKIPTPPPIAQAPPQPIQRQVSCPNCQATNRLPEGSDFAQARCGNCDTPLLPQLFSIKSCPSCGAKNKVPPHALHAALACGKCKARLSA